jgi:hypothetical protein
MNEGLWVEFLLLNIYFFSVIPEKMEELETLRIENVKLQKELERLRLKYEPRWCRCQQCQEIVYENNWRYHRCPSKKYQEENTICSNCGEWRPHYKDNPHRFCPGPGSPMCYSCKGPDSSRQVKEYPLKN